MGLTIITGHYGCGKTTLALDMSYEFADVGRTALIDLDIANPFFRSSDKAAALEAAGITLAGPQFANSNLDAPALSAGIYTLLADPDPKLEIIMDVGGDDEGATTLGRFREEVLARGYRMLYVVNQRRLQTSTAEKALEILDEIQQACGLEATALAGNTHLQQETDVRVILDSLPYLEEISDRSGLPVEFITAPHGLAAQVQEQCPYPVREVGIHLLRPWD